MSAANFASENFLFFRMIKVKVIRAPFRGRNWELPMMLFDWAAQAIRAVGLIAVARSKLRMASIA